MANSKYIFLIAAAVLVSGVLVIVIRLRQDPLVISPSESIGKFEPSRESENESMIQFPAGSPDRPSEPVERSVPEPFALAPLPLNLQGPAFERRADGRVVKKDVYRMMEDLNNPNQDPVEDIQILTSVVAAYHRIFRQNPIAGENREVVEAFTGKNPYRLILMDPSHPAIDGNGELIDRWNVPYRFHPISRDYMEIMSAGEDRQFGTGDDVMVEEPFEFGRPQDSLGGGDVDE